MDAYQIGPVAIDADLLVCRRDGVRIPLRPKAVELLVALIASGQAALDTSELLDALWPSACVNRKNVAVLVAEIRNALAAHFPDASPIAYVRGRGYRLTAPVVRVADERLAVARWGGNTAAAKPRLITVVKRIAAIPRTPALQSMCRAWHETLLTTLSHDAQLCVLGRGLPAGSVPPARTDLHIEGCIRLIDEILEIHYRVVLPDGTIGASGLRRGKLGDFGTLETDLVDELRSRLGELSRSSLGLTHWGRHAESSAFYHYSRGRRLWDRRCGTALGCARASFEAALQEEAGFAPAIAGLADCESMRSHYAELDPCASAKAAQALAQRALVLDANLACAHASLGWIALARFEWAEAFRRIERAIERDSRHATAYHWLAVLLAAKNRPAEALQAARTSSALDPASVACSVEIAQQLLNMGEFRRATEQLRSALELDSQNALAHGVLALAFSAMSEWDHALRHALQAVELSPQTIYFRGIAGYVHARRGELARAHQLMGRLELLARRSPHQACGPMMICLGLGEHRRALSWFSKGMSVHAPWVINLGALPLFDPLRAHPQVKRELLGVGLRAS